MKSQSGFVLPLLLALVALAIIGGGAYWYTQTKPASQSTNVEQTTQATSTAQTPNLQTNTFQTSSANISVNNILVIQTMGGLCPYGICSDETIIGKDGTLVARSGDGKTKSVNLDINTIKNLKNLIDSSDYSKLRSTAFIDICPTAYDGQEKIYKFQTSHGEEIIDSCETKINGSDPLFQEIQRVERLLY